VKRLGPELKMPNLKRGEVKVPPFLSDLYLDLRDRRLLPLIGLILVAIAATPILLGGDSKGPEPVAPGPVAITGGSVPASQRLTVVKAAPGLRNYKKRLDHRSPTNPFKQRFTAPRLNGARLNEPTSTSTSTSTTTTTEAGSLSSGGSAPEAGTPTTTTTTTVVPHSSERLTFFTWGIEVEVTKLASEKVDPEADPEITTRPRVLAQTPIPGPQTPVVTFLGLSREAAEKKEQKALLLVSDEVSHVSDNAECVSAREGCQLIEAKPGQAIDFVYGPGETSYTIKVLKIELIVTGHSEHHS
jgi:hypothetical protein